MSLLRLLTTGKSLVGMKETGEPLPADQPTVVASIRFGEKSIQPQRQRRNRRQRRSRSLENSWRKRRVRSEARPAGADGESPDHDAHWGHRAQAKTDPRRPLPSRGKRQSSAALLANRASRAEGSGAPGWMAETRLTGCQGVRGARRRRPAILRSRNRRSRRPVACTRSKWCEMT